MNFEGSTFGRERKYKNTTRVNGLISLIDDYKFLHKNSISEEKIFQEKLRVDGVNDGMNHLN